MRMTRTLSFAVEMVQACLPLVDLRREGAYGIDMFDVKSKDRARTVHYFELVVALTGRDRIRASCLVNSSNWAGQCRLSPIDNSEAENFICWREGSRMKARPNLGPGSRHDALPVSRAGIFVEELGLAIASEWDIWPESDDFVVEPLFGAWRKSWLMGHAMHGTFDQVVEWIRQHEAGRRGSGS